MNAWAALALFLLCGCVSRADARGGPNAAEAAELAELGYYEPAAALEVKRARHCPGALDGSELIGAAAQEWQLTDWSNSRPLSLAELRGRVVVVRFWTTGCRFCERTMPVLQKLADEFRDRPVTFIGAFHDKPAGSIVDMTMPAATAKTWGVRFPLAFDRKWHTLRSAQG